MQLFFKFFLHFGLLFCLSLVWGAAAQERLSLDYFLPDSCNYDKQIPAPSSVLGFEVGEFQVTQEQGVAYIKALAAASDRVLLRQYGWTHERAAALSAHHLDGRKHPRHRPHQGGTRLAERPVRRRENQTQPESRYRAEVMLDWKPNIYTCAHEQGSEANYHFSPERPSIRISGPSGMARAS